jgi:hypothetical protein
MAFQNISSSPQGLPLGVLSGPDPAILSTLVLTTPGGRREFSGLSERAAKGATEPLIIPLMPNAVYAVHVPLTAYRPVRAGLTTSGAIGEATELSVSFVGDQAVCDLYGYPHPNYVPCWSGELKSNTIRLSPR